LHTIKQGRHRPGEIEKAIENISKKVLSERFRKLTAYGLLTKKKFNETILHTEYHLTEKGKKLLNIISQINQLDNE
jgi:DNA-binding HxlR family transcriptional regulator